ncbi:MAG: divergent polysaccharide deacetylase family protein [Pseudomonadota bacterium]
MSNDLYTPLTRKTPQQGRGFRVGLIPALSLSGLVLGGLGAFVFLSNDPLGGEPYIVAAVPPRPAETAKTDMPADKPAEQPFAATTAEVDPALDRVGHPTVSILTPGGEDGQMQVKTITLPGEAPPPSYIPAPDARVIEKSRYGLLPKIGPDGSRSSKLYAHVADPEEAVVTAKLPKIAIIMGGLGLSQSGTADAITKLPPQVTLAFAPYGTFLQKQVDKAREQGHEVMLQIPMEPFDYPSNDPGPQTLLSTLSREQNLDRMHWCFSRFSGYTGVVNYLGAKFTANGAALRPMMQDVRDRGLTFVDDGSSPRTVTESLAADLKLGYAKSQLTLDVVPAPDKIDEALGVLEAQARDKGSAIGYASALPLSMERIAKWAKDLENRGFVLVPVSAVVSGEPNS